MARGPLAFDIETVGVDWESLHPEVQEILLKRARTDEERAEVPERLGLHPGTGRIVAIGLWRPGDDRGGVLVEGPSAGWRPFDAGTGTSGKAMIFRGSEREILEEFWRFVGANASTLITYNGRGFDGPYIHIRSAMLGVAPTRNLVPYRYSFRDHCDLAEVLTFYRARPMDSLAFWCHQFGIASPKEEMDGGDVAEMYALGELDTIARYCLRDARATAELYRKLEPLVHIMDPAARDPAALRDPGAMRDSGATRDLGTQREAGVPRDPGASREPGAGASG